MKNKLKHLISTPFFRLLIIQFFILSAAFLLFLFHRGGSILNFTANDYIYLAGTAAAEPVSIRESSGFTGDFIQTSPLSLKAGSYRLQLFYAATAEQNAIRIYTDQLSDAEKHSVELILASDCHTAAMNLDLPRSVTDLKIAVSYAGAGSLEIMDLSLVSTNARYKRILFYALLICLLLGLLHRFRRSDSSTRAVMLALAGIFAVSCYPLYVDYLVVGHDIPFHLLRIEGIADGLSAGIFPVKIHPVWAKDYGYAAGVLYGDILLYFPALLRRLGFSVQAAYQLFTAAVNLGTVLLSYACFQRMFRSRRLGLLGSFIYTLSYYRLADTYTRAAVGEYTAMMFLPLVMLGFYLIFSGVQKSNWWKYSIVTALGLTGLIQTHVLSCEMAGFCILLVCLILVRKIFRKYTLFSLAGSLTLTLLFNLGFLVPFLEYFSTDLYINSPDWTGNVLPYFQLGGLFPVQLFSIFQHSNGGAWSTMAGVFDEASYGLGIFFLLVIGLFLYLLFAHGRECRAHRNFKAACICFALGCLLAFMSTCHFPWDSIAALNAGAKKLIFSLQFPWRLLAFSTVLLTFTACFSISALFKIHSRDIAGICLMGMLLLMTVNIGWYLFDLVYTVNPYRVYDTAELNTMTLYSGEYLPAGTDTNLIRANLTHMEKGSGIESFQKHGTDITCHIIQIQPGGYVDFPLLYYRHYVCKRTDTGEELPVSAGYNNMVRVTFPNRFDGNIHIYFREPWYWRLSEAVSLLTAGCCLILLAVRSRASVQIIQFSKPR